MKKFLQETGYAMYLGGALAMFANMSVCNWQAYAIIIPVVILVAWKKGETE